MKIYVKELGKEENIQILNTSTDKFFMPRIGDTVLVSYTVVKVDWISFRSGNESAVLWVTKKKDNQIKVIIYKIVRNGVWKSIDNKEILTETFIERTKLTESFIPKVGDEMEVEGNVYVVSEVVKVGGLLEFSELKVIVRELS